MPRNCSKVPKLRRLSLITGPAINNIYSKGVQSVHIKLIQHIVHNTGLYVPLEMIMNRNFNCLWDFPEIGTDGVCKNLEVNKLCQKLENNFLQRALLHITTGI